MNYLSRNSHTFISFGQFLEIDFVSLAGSCFPVSLCGFLLCVVLFTLKTTASSPSLYRLVLYRKYLHWLKILGVSQPFLWLYLPWTYLSSLMKYSKSGTKREVYSGKFPIREVL